MQPSIWNLVPERKGELNHVGECFFRHTAGTYYALVKVAGKQIKRNLRIADLSLAKRRLADFRTNSARLTGTEKSLIFEGLTDQ